MFILYLHAGASATPIKAVKQQGGGQEGAFRASPVSEKEEEKGPCKAGIRISFSRSGAFTCSDRSQTKSLFFFLF